MKAKALQRRNSFLLVLAAFIWGIAFVAQSEGGKFGRSPNPAETRE